KNLPWKGMRLGILDPPRIKTLATACTHFLPRKIDTWHSVNRFPAPTAFSQHLSLSSGTQFTPKQVAVKPNFVDIRTADAPRDNYYVFVGRLSAEKGIVELVAALKGSDKQLKVIGEGPLTKMVSDMIKGCDNISLVGQKSKKETMQIVASSQALIVPSVCYEGAVPL